MNGKSKCKILKDIRRQIAQDNDIEFVTSECKFQGECSGTCPKCESELRYLENELQKRQKAGKAIAIAGIAATLAVTSTGCVPDIPSLFGTQGSPPPLTTEASSELDGDISYEETQTQPSEEELMGEPLTEDTTETTEEMLMGVVVDWE